MFKISLNLMTMVKLNFIRCMRLLLAYISTKFYNFLKPWLASQLIVFGCIPCLVEKPKKKVTSSSSLKTPREGR